MAPKRKPQVQREGPAKKKGRQGAEEEDSFRSTAEALRAAPTEKHMVRVDPACPLSHTPGTQPDSCPRQTPVHVRAGTLAYPRAAQAVLPPTPLWPQVHEDCACTLNQTNVGSNNNKLYIIQLLEEGDRFACWNRWGRVGEVGQSKLSYFKLLEDAKKDFEKKFWDKTKNSWVERDHFVAPILGKYTLIEVQGDDEAQEAVVQAPLRLCPAAPAHPSPLPLGGWRPSEDRGAARAALLPRHSHAEARHQHLQQGHVRECHDPHEPGCEEDAPGKLSKQQIARGFEALEALEVALRAPADGGLSLEELSSHFYTVIPHNFGRNRPPPINSPELLQAKKDMLLVTFSRGAGNGADGQTGQGRRGTHGHEGPERWTEWVAGRTGREKPGRWLGWGCTGGQTGGVAVLPVVWEGGGWESSGQTSCPCPSLWVLADIELAQTLQASPEEEKGEEVPHPLDRDYQLLKCQLQLLDPEAAEYKGLRRALGLQAAVGLVHTSLHLGTQLLLFLQGDRFQAHSKLGNRRLLWHGTNVAVVAAILTSGLRIMPHSGGCVGKGIYFASENSKSAGYVTGMSCGAHQIGYVFLGEMALGREHHITIDEPSLKQPPPGFDSVIAQGHTEPDPTQDTELELDG
ncbi:protein mono-ADP-ribosyltransferase PARP3 isoform X2 [Ailuropoda melanoleuca]|uniref:protein mono-ADP-ribosyltransferase PARP3 isoform X2 n=1 Tax=Ailuropoda melanoleuca TaxID=9646 RepID=UPI0014940BA5|nr:protein mono-ADP-ribosyltransferase PARP3 isoform X2 [Ailuropoda melanoleuca]